MKINKILPDLYVNQIRDRVDKIENDVSEQNKKLVAENGTSFRFGVNEKGEYGYIVTDEEGADSVIPFSSDDGGEEYRVQVVNRLKNINVGITDDSSWEEIFEAMKTLFPSTYDVLANLAKADWSLTGGETFTWKQTSIELSCGTTLGYKQAQSKSINVSGFSKLSYSWSKGDTKGTQYVRLVHSGGTLNVPDGTGTLDVSSIVGEAYFILYAKSERYVYNSTYHYSSAKTTVTTLKFSE